MTNRLLERGISVQLSNLAVDGSETADVLRALAEPRVQQELQGASWVFVSAAGNDFSHALRGKSGTSTPDTAAALVSARQNLGEVVRRLHELAPRARLLLLGLYNPFEVQVGSEAAAGRLLLEWNTAIEEAALVAPGALVVPIADLFHQRPDRLAKDQYHPGPTGHTAIAERVLAAFPD